MSKKRKCLVCQSQRRAGLPICDDCLAKSPSALRQQIGYYRHQCTIAGIRHMDELTDLYKTAITNARAARTPTPTTETVPA